MYLKVKFLQNHISVTEVQCMIWHDTDWWNSFAFYCSVTSLGHKNIIFCKQLTEYLHLELVNNSHSSVNVVEVSMVALWGSMYVFIALGSFYYKLMYTVLELRRFTLLWLHTIPPIPRLYLVYAVLYTYTSIESGWCCGQHSCFQK